MSCENLVSCPDYFSHAEGKNSLVNSLFNFCSVRHDRGTPIRLLHENDVTYCTKWLPKKTRRLSAMQVNKLGRTRERPAKEFQEFREQTVCVSELENWPCEVCELQSRQ